MSSNQRTTLTSSTQQFTLTSSSHQFTWTSSTQQFTLTTSFHQPTWWSSHRSFRQARRCPYMNGLLLTISILMRLNSDGRAPTTCIDEPLAGLQINGLLLAIQIDEAHPSTQVGEPLPLTIFCLTSFSPQLYMTSSYLVHKEKLLLQPT